jgi:hypothetical protein
MNCDYCFHDYIAKCNLAITIYAQLAPLSDFTWIITDKFGNKYQGEFTTDSDGFWQIQVSDLPPGMLTQYSGDFTLQVQDTGCKPVKFKIAQEVDCINFTIKGGTYEKDTIGCDFSCTPAAGSQTQLFPFTNDDEITITWTAGLLAAFGNSPVIQVYHLISGTTYQLVDAAIQEAFTDGVLTSIIVNNGGVATGYILIS